MEIELSKFTAFMDGSEYTIWGPCTGSASDSCNCPSCENASRIEAQGLDWDDEYEAASKRGFDK